MGKGMGLTTMEAEMAWQVATQAGGMVSGARIWRTQSDRASSSSTLDAMAPKKSGSARTNAGMMQGLTKALEGNEGENGREDANHDNNKGGNSRTQKRQAQDEE
jgi:hypothetical protein